MLMPQELLATFDMKSAGLTILEAAAATATLIIAGTFAFSYGKVQEAIFKSAQERVKRHSRLRPAVGQAIGADPLLEPHRLVAEADACEQDAGLGVVGRSRLDTDGVDDGVGTGVVPSEHEHPHVLP